MNMLHNRTRLTAYVWRGGDIYLGMEKAKGYMPSTDFEADIINAFLRSGTVDTSKKDSWWDLSKLFGRQ